MAIRLLVFYVVLLLTIAISCNNATDLIIPAPFDNEAQISKDQDLISKYLETHYYNTNDSEFWTIGAGSEVTGALPIEDQLPLHMDSKLDSIEGIEANGTIATYKMYYYTEETGTYDGNVGFARPSPVDSVFVKYSGVLLDSTVFDSSRDASVWFPLYQTISGFGLGLTKFSRGTISLDSENDFISPGKGYLIFPSGLGYRNLSLPGIPANSSLIFRIVLEDVHLIDTDLDGVPTKFEVDIDASGNISFFDTDGDDIYDFRDLDDDNDSVNTLVEVNEEYVLDNRGNYDFDYDITDKKIVAKSTSDGVPNFLNSTISIE